ncbi:hypothetical protein DPMN_136698 [Dreissena polymorpha]|uniref:Uncharacterized protein n=1 Tax=Dreissena polymorpha TaxID=45954 RepID=A0A9D4G0D3_DREPO|nr:hypothetical protein DPMN_136698 [Dreissena polymorpha]
MGSSLAHLRTMPGAVSARDTMASSPSCLQESSRFVSDNTCRTEKCNDCYIVV